MLRVFEEESKEKNNRDAELLVVTDIMERKRLVRSMKSRKLELRKESCRL
jgi:hypothetical protein